METFCPNGGDRVDVQGKNYHVFGYLKNFLFPKEYLDKKIGILSGGEKNRVALALLFTKKVDCLILDEPTNDLDIPTINILEEYIRNFEGCVIFVSHDRYFVDKMAGKLLIFKGDGIIEESYESYTEYLENEKELAELDEIERLAGGEPQKEQVVQKSEPSKKLSFKDKHDYEKLPAEIESLELKIKELEIGLSNPDVYQKVGLSVLAHELDEAKSMLESKVERYFEIEEKLSQMSAS
jgi:ATP-binding cassette subfamily F protein uup